MHLFNLPVIALDFIFALLINKSILWIFSIEYSEKIYDYTMNINTTMREGFGRIDLLNDDFNN